jgi:hypothetical protein
MARELSEEKWRDEELSDEELSDEGPILEELFGERIELPGRGHLDCFLQSPSQQESISRESTHTAHVTVHRAE